MVQLIFSTENYRKLLPPWTENAENLFLASRGPPRDQDFGCVRFSFFLTFRADWTCSAMTNGTMTNGTTVHPAVIDPTFQALGKFSASMSVVGSFFIIFTCVFFRDCLLLCCLTVVGLCPSAFDVPCYWSAFLLASRSSFILSHIDRGGALSAC